MRDPKQKMACNDSVAIGFLMKAASRWKNSMRHSKQRSGITVLSRNQSLVVQLLPRTRKIPLFTSTALAFACPFQRSPANLNDDEPPAAFRRVKTSALPS